MNFDLSEDQRAFQAAVCAYLRAECPLSRALDACEPDGSDDFGVWRGLMELGVGGVAVPEEHGGSGLGLLDLAVIAESIGRYAGVGPFFEHAVATYALQLSGDADLMRTWLPRLAVGDARATFAFAEGDNCWMPEDWRLANGAGSITGRKTMCPFADRADLIVVGLENGDLAVVDAANAGVQLTALPSVDGGRRLYEVDFDHAAVRPLGGQDLSARVVDVALVLLAADAFGGAARCLEMTVDYVMSREQFDRPIGEFQAVKHQLADMAIKVEPAVGLYWYAAYSFDREPSSATLAAALAKAHLTEVYADVSRRAVELHGGIGYTWDFGFHVWLRRALFDRNFLGTPARHRARVAALSNW